MLVSFFIVLATSCTLAVATPGPVDRLRRTAAQRHTLLPTPRAALDVSLSVPTPNKQSFFVNGSSLPLLDQTVQDSYAGRLTIGSNLSRALFFWYWPSNSNNSDSVAIWLNGGPGCSSMTGFLSELGPYTFKPGTGAPTINAYAWSTVSDVVFIDQPFGVGYSQGTPDVVDEFDVAEEFYGFLRTFYTVFPELLAKKLFIAGESYAGFYIPYIAQRILSADDAEKAAVPIDLQGILINDGVYSSFLLSQTAPIADFIVAHAGTLDFAQQDVRAIVNASQECGLQDLMDQLVYPPRGPLFFNESALGDECLRTVFDAWDHAAEVNPCFNIYRITDKCPTPSDPIENYFSRSDVQDVLHVPGFGEWEQCVDTVFRDGDPSDLTETLFPDLITALPRGVTLWHGLLDMLLLANGTRLTIQNLTWAGAQGFQSPIVDQIVLDGQPKGVVHSERGLTYYEIEDSGHMIPEDQPEVALEVFKIFLGQPSGLQTVLTNGSSTTPSRTTGGDGPANPNSVPTASGPASVTFGRCTWFLLFFLMLAIV